MARPLWDTSLYYSFRRHFVDDFHFRHVSMFPVGSRILDLGGHKSRKRGQFDIRRYDLNVVYANLSTDKGADVQADAAHVPFKDSCFDAVICSELLEHVPDPLAVLREGYRVLREGGTLLICVPFLFRIHGDPYDYGRYTDQYWRENLTKIGFINIEIERQGGFWSVLMDMLRELAYQMRKEGRPSSRRLRRLVDAVIGWGRRSALKWDERLAISKHPFFNSYTTGFGIRAVKS